MEWRQRLYKEFPNWPLVEKEFKKEVIKAHQEINEALGSVPRAYATQEIIDALFETHNNLKGSTIFLSKLIKATSGYAFLFLSDKEKNDPNLVIDAVEQNPATLEFASEELQSDRKFILAIVKKNGYALGYVSAALKLDREIVLAAVQQSGIALEYASDQLKLDRKIVLTAVQQSGYALQYASDGFKSDREIVFAAVMQDGCALEFATTDLKSDREIVLAAVNEYGDALEYASDELKLDWEVILAAVTTNRSALRYANEALKLNPQLQFIANIENDELRAKEADILLHKWRSGAKEVQSVTRTNSHGFFNSVRKNETLDQPISTALHIYL